MKNTLVILATTLALGLGASAHAADGAALYESNCASCHGASGAGDTPVGSAMSIPTITGKSAADVAKHVMEAANHVAPKGKLSAEELEAVAQYVAGLK